MFGTKNEKELTELTPAALEAQRNQRSLNRRFGFLLCIAILLLAMFVYEIILLI